VHRAGAGRARQRGHRPRRQRNRPAVWILFLNADGTVASETKISETTGGFGGVLNPLDNFGFSVASLGDLDGDGIDDLAVGAINDDDGNEFSEGAVWILFLNADGTVASETKTSETTGGFGGILDAGDHFGGSVAAMSSPTLSRSSSQRYAASRLPRSCLNGP
jgi:hypothetical protein